MRMSCANAISTGTEYFASKRRMMMIEIRNSDAISAMPAVRAICAPNVGPIDSLVNCASLTPNFWSSARRTCSTLAGWSVFVEI